MLKTISVSVIIPIFNPNLEYLKQALDSFFSQTLKNTELVLVDDGSSFDYSNEIKSYLSSSRVKFIKLNKNVGSGIARNEGIKAASGEYLGFLDSDDYYYSNDVLEKLYNIAIETSINVVGAIPYSDQKNNLSPIYWSFHNYKNLFKDQIVNINDYQICYGYWSFIYKRDFIISNKIYFKSLRRFQDPPWFLTVLNKAQEYYAADFPYYVHREKERSEYNLTKAQLDDYIEGLNSVIKMSLKMKYYDLHTFLYRKLFFNEYLFVKESREKSNVDYSKEFNSLLKSFDFEVIKNTDKDLPLLSDMSEFDKLNLADYSNLNY